MTRLAEALVRIGPVMAQLFGQTEAPMMISMLPPADHFNADGSIAEIARNPVNPTAANPVPSDSETPSLIRWRKPGRSAHGSDTGTACRPLSTEPGPGARGGRSRSAADT